MSINIFSPKKKMYPLTSGLLAANLSGDGYGSPRYSSSYLILICLQNFVHLKDYDRFEDTNASYYNYGLGVVIMGL